MRRERQDFLAIHHGIDQHALRNQIRWLVDEHRLIVEAKAQIPPDHSPQVAALQRELRDLEKRRPELERTYRTISNAKPRVFGRDEHAAKQLGAQRAIETLDAKIDKATPALKIELAYQDTRTLQMLELAKMPKQEPHIADELQHRTHQLVLASINAPASHLRQLGPYPRINQDRRVWQSAVQTIETYRTQHHIDDPVWALGQQPQDRPTETAWVATLNHLGTLLGHNRLVPPEIVKQPVREIEPPTFEPPQRERGFSLDL